MEEFKRLTGILNLHNKWMILKKPTVEEQLSYYDMRFNRFSQPYPEISFADIIVHCEVRKKKIIKDHC